MHKWVHLYIYLYNFNRKKFALYARGKPKGHYKKLIRYLKDLVDFAKPRRFFFLFEDNPHLFLAIEIKNWKRIEEKLLNLKTPSCVASIHPEYGKVTDKDAALKLFQAGSEYAFYRISKDYKQGYYRGDIDKMLHCFCNQNVVSWENEIWVYLHGLLHRGINKKHLLKFIVRLSKFYSLSTRERKRLFQRGIVYG